jgi:CDGSH-type Zn-finger protein
VIRNGPYRVEGGVPLIPMTIEKNRKGECRKWSEEEQYPVGATYLLCRCGASKNKPFCDTSHTTIPFDGTETTSRVPYGERAEALTGPALSLTDDPELCVHARFCLRAGGIWNNVRRSGDPNARRIAIEEAGNCPSGRLVVWDPTTGKAIEPVYMPSIGVIEYPEDGIHGPLWVRGGIPIESAAGLRYEVRNRVTLCRCGQSGSKPFCDGSHRD